MMLRGHLIVATAAYISFKEFTTKGEWSTLDLTILYEYFIIMLGVLIPDIDNPSSKIGRRVKYLAYPIYIIFGHRGITHSALFVGAMYYTGYYYDITTVKYLAFGAALHLLGDYLTPTGIPLFYPYKKNYRAMIVADTNGLSETVLSFGVMLLSVAYVFDFL